MGFVVSIHFLFRRPKEKQEKTLPQGVKGFFMSRFFKCCYNWPGILRQDLQLIASETNFDKSTVLRPLKKLVTLYVFREGSLDLQCTEYSFFMAYTFKRQQPFFWLLSVFLDWSFACGFWITDVEIYNVPNIALSRKMKGKNNVLNKLDNRNIEIKWI